MRELVPSDIITEKLLRDGKLKTTETEVEDALESTYLICMNEHKSLKLATDFLLSLFPKYSRYIYTVFLVLFVYSNNEWL